MAERYQRLDAITSTLLRVDAHPGGSPGRPNFVDHADAERGFATVRSFADAMVIPPYLLDTDQED